MSGGGKLASVADVRQNATDAKQASEYELICGAIAQLEAELKAKKQVDVRRKDNVSLRNRLVKLIGKKPVFECSLNGVQTGVLWDTGSMISLGTAKWLRENFPDIEIRPISEFLEDGEEVRFMAANNTEVPVTGCAVLNFSIGEESFQVPFLITENELSEPIVGYNVIEHFIKKGNSENVASLLAEAIRGGDVGKVEVMVNMISNVDDDDDFLGDLKAVKPCVIPPKSSVRVRCRVKGDVKGVDLSFLCSEPCVGEWDDELVVTESLGEIKRGRTPHVNVEIRNTSCVEKRISKGMVVGEICAIKAVLPIKLFNDPPDSGEKVDIAKVEVSSDPAPPEK